MSASRPLRLALAAAALAAAAHARAQAPTGVAPLTVTAQPKTAPAADVTLTVGADADAIAGYDVSIWPAGALEARRGGAATLACDVNVHGLAERCRVAHEDPPGREFGAAALALRPTFKLAPRLGPDGRPAAGPMTILVVFKPPRTESNLAEVVGQGLDPLNKPRWLNPGRHEIDASALRTYGNPIATRRVTMMDAPAWIEAPDFDDVARAYPAEAAGAEGYAVAHCRVQPDGSLSHCAVARETPARRGFGKAAVALAAEFRVDPRLLADAPKGAPVEVDVPVRFVPPGREADRSVARPLWLSTPDPATRARLFPQAAAAKGVAAGDADLRCEVAAGGVLAACEVERAQPDGLGFDDAAVKLASGLKMNLWSADAGPVQGGTVRVRVELDQTPR